LLRETKEFYRNAQLISNKSRPRNISKWCRNLNKWTAIPSPEHGNRKRYLNRSEYALRFLCDIWLNGIYDQWLRRHRIVWTYMVILKVGLKSMAVAFYNTWRRKKWTEKNLQPGWVLQGKSEQGMSSLSLLPENEELATASCGSNLYPNHMSPSSVNSTYKTIHFR